MFSGSLNKIYRYIDIYLIPHIPLSSLYYPTMLPDYHVPRIVFRRWKTSEDLQDDPTFWWP